MEGEKRINALFQVHMLNEKGVEHATALAQAFSDLVDFVESLPLVVGRESALMKTHLEEAGFYAKKALASHPQNQK